MDMKFSWIRKDKCMKMNKKRFIQKLAEELSYTKEECIEINEILEKHFFIKESNKPKVVAELTNKKGIQKEEAERIYNVATKIIKDEVKNKLKHPFRSQD